MQPPLALALRLKGLGKDVTMFVTPPCDGLVRAAGISCVAASENVADLLAALGTVDLSDTSMCGLLRTVGALNAYEATAEYRAAIRADTVAGYELAVAVKPDVILLPGYEYGVWASVGEALGIPVVRYDLQPCP